MFKKNLLVILVAVLCSISTVFAEIPKGYYDAAKGKSGRALQVALHDIISSNTFVIDYGSTDAARLMDFGNNGYLYDIYSYPCCNIYKFGTAANEQCTKYSFEHIFCQNWFNPGNAYDCKVPAPFAPCSDLHHVFPTDHYVNSSYHNNSPYGEVVMPRKIAQNGTQWGYVNYLCFPDSAVASKPVFEPAQEFKGDIARALLYISIRYMFEDETFADTSDMTYRSQFKPWALELLKKWCALDPVSAKERDRNDNIFTYYQRNRNPLIDHPELVELIWGNDSLYNTFGYVNNLDTMRPVVLKATSTPQTISLYFSKELDKASAEDIANYSVTKGICIESASYADNIVTLTINGKLTRNTRYFVYCNGVQSTDGLFVKATSTPFTHGKFNSFYSCSGPREVLAAWTFDEYTPTHPMIIPAGAEIGIPAILNNAYIYGDSTHGASLFDSLEVKSAAGNLAGDPRSAAKAGQALKLCKNTANGKSIVIEFPTKGFEEIMVTFIANRTKTGHAQHTWELSTDGENYMPLDIENTMANYGYVDATQFPWMRQIDLREYSQVNDQDSVFLRLTISGATGAQGSNTIDNIVVYGESLGYVPGTNGINDEAVNDFAIFPNPNNGCFEISCGEGSTFSMMQLYDLSGRVVLKQNVNDKKFSINMNDQPTGIYFVKMIDTRKNISIVKKIIVTK